MDKIIKEVENLCLSMHTFKEHLEDNLQLPIVGEKLRYFAAEIERIIAIEPVCTSYLQKLTIEEYRPILVMRLEQAKGRLESLNKNHTVYEIIDELSNISSSVQETASTVQWYTAD